ncbi:hypothetical protein BGZ83_007862 [Gryganskiella cystojenkinii]|nr:hypothetical protein BGZ83_007862 [Gryganskiella cystojenkinii]
MPELSTGNPFQSFRYKDDDPVRIQSYLHPTLPNKLFVIWSDIEDCFPGVTRIQDGDRFVAFLRDERLYRCKPHGIEYVPGVVLSVIREPGAILWRESQRHQGSDMTPDPPALPDQSSTSHPGQPLLSSSSSSSAPSTATSSGGISTSKTQKHTSLSSTSKSKQTTAKVAPILSISEADSVSIPEIDTFELASTMTDPSTTTEPEIIFGEAAMTTAADADDFARRLTPDRMAKLMGEITMAIVNNTPMEMMDKDIIRIVTGMTPDAIQSSPYHKIGLSDMILESGGARNNVNKISSEDADQGEQHRPLSVSSILEQVASQAIRHKPLEITEKETKRSIQNQDQVTATPTKTEGTSSEDSPEAERLQKKPATTSEHSAMVQSAPLSSSVKGEESSLNKDGDSVAEKVAPSEKQETIDTVILSPKVNGSAHSSTTPSTPPSIVSSPTINRPVPRVSGGTSTREEIVAHRAKLILSKRYNWIDSPCSKLMYILPRQSNLTKETMISKTTWRDFDLYFLCDCADIEPSGGKETGVTTTEPIHRAVEAYYPVFKDASQYGDHFMAVLEMMKYGVTIDGQVKVKKIDSPSLQKSIASAITFLEIKDFISSEQFEAQGFPTLETIRPVAPLPAAELVHLYEHLIPTVHAYGHDFAIRTRKGDIRYVCANHRAQLAPEFDPQLVSKFKRPGSNNKSSWDPQTAALFVQLQSSEDAWTFHQDLLKLRAVIVLTVFLDWDLAEEDEFLLKLMITNITVETGCACVKIMVRKREEEADALIPGFGHGYYGAILSAIQNTQIEAFSLERRSPEDGVVRQVELSEFRASSFYMDVCIARFTRNFQEPGLDLGLLVTDFDQAVESLRRDMNGLCGLHRVTLEAEQWQRIVIYFGDDLGDIADKGPLEESLEEFFNRRSHDVMTIRTCDTTNELLLKTHCLKDVSIRFDFPLDGPRIREMIKNNTKLQKMELVIGSNDDPCQIFEYFKAVMTNHPSLEYFQLDRDREAEGKSNFVWTGVADRSKMTLTIQSDADDKIGSLLQKYSTSLYKLWIHGISVQDAAILEKVTRTRKSSQLKLTAITLCDACSSIPQQALDDIAKVVLRTTLSQFSITGTVMARTASKLADFMTVVGGKITTIHLFGDQTKSILLEMAKRIPESVALHMLQELKIAGPFDATTKDLAWLRTLFKNTALPLTMLELRRVNLSHQGWMTLAQEVNFKTLHYFRVAPEVPLKTEAITAFVAAVPDDSELENFHLDTDGHNRQECQAYRTYIESRLKKDTAFVSIGKYFD